MTEKILNVIKYAAAGALFSFLIIFFAAPFYKKDVRNDIASENYVSKTADLPFFAHTTSAKSSCLIDAGSGRILFSQDSDKPLPMASTTKIMTAITVIENTSLDEIVVIPTEATGIMGSSIYLCAGEELTVRELLYGLMLESGNDAACALAIHTAGSIEGFCELMNKKAKELGLCNTSFKNPHGLTTKDHYTTAYELSKITAYAMKNDVFREIAATEKYVIAEREKCAARYFSNHNRLLRSLDICTGVKTGYTELAGRCLVTSCEKDGSRFVAVTLNDKNDWIDHKNMLQFAAENFESVKIADKGDITYCYRTKSFPFETVTVSNTDDIYVTVLKNEDEPFSLSAEISAIPVEKGEIAGRLTINYKEESESFPLYATDVAK